MKDKELKRITIKITKKTTHYYDPQKKILIPISNKSRKTRKYIDNPYFHFKLQLILPGMELSKKTYIKKFLNHISPEILAERIIELKNKNPEMSFKKILSIAEFNLIQEISAKILGTDDEPTKIYNFLSTILKETSKEMDKNSTDYTYKLTKELYKKGLQF